MSEHSDTLSETQLAHAVSPETLYEALVHKAGELVALTDRDGVVTFVNQRVLVISGFPPSEFVGKHFTDMVHPDDAQKCREMLERVLADGSPFTGFAVRAVAPDGAVYHIAVNGSLVETDDGPRVLSVCRDMTQEVVLREQLAARNKALCALSEIIVALTSTECANQALQVALDKILAEVGLSIGGILLREKDGSFSVRAHAGVDAAWYQARKNAYGEAVWRYQDALAGPVHVPDLQSLIDTDEAIRDLVPEGDVRGLVAVPLGCGNEMTAVLLLALPGPELNLAQMEFVNLAAGVLGPAVENARLIEAARVRSLEMETLAKEARHRIKNNLQMVTGLLSMCSREQNDESKAMQRCLRHISAISSVNDLLNPANAAECVDIEQCLTGIARSVIAGAGRGDDIELRFGGEDCELSADVATALGIIVNELVTNALTHGFRDLDQGCLEIRVSREADRKCVEVLDCGVGLPAGFDLTQDWDSGLGIAKALATYGLGGTLELEPVSSGGTRARIVF